MQLGIYRSSNSLFRGVERCPRGLDRTSIWVEVDVSDPVGLDMRSNKLLSWPVDGEALRRRIRGGLRGLLRL